MKNCRFSTNGSINFEMAIFTIWQYVGLQRKTNRNSYAIYPIVPMTLSKIDFKVTILFVAKLLENGTYLQRLVYLYKNLHSPYSLV